MFYLLLSSIGKDQLLISEINRKGSAMKDLLVVMSLLLAVLFSLAVVYLMIFYLSASVA